MNARSPIKCLPQIEVFLAAAEAMSFSDAARDMGLTPAGVSRAIGKLEENLGVSLFARTTRSVRLTEEGQLLLERSAETMSSLRDVEDILQGRQSEPKGVLRISVPSTYGHFRLINALPAFAQKHPGLVLQVSISNRNINLIDDGFDAAVRLGELSDSRMISRKLEDTPVKFYAAPRYLKSHGTPKTIADLKSHACIAFLLPSTGKPIPWLYRSKEIDGEWPPKGQVQFEDDVLGCLNYAIGGGGICQMLSFTAEDAVARGELVPVLEKFGGRTRPFSLIYRKNTRLSAKINALSAFLAGLKGV
jgi:DNA-binding transcriptional LysR family regulator